MKIDKMKMTEIILNLKAVEEISYVYAPAEETEEANRIINEIYDLSENLYNLVQDCFGF